MRLALSLLLALLATALLGVVPAWSTGADPGLSAGAARDLEVGSLEGTVIDKYSREPLFPADVVIVGTGLGGITDREGGRGGITGTVDLKPSDGTKSYNR